MREEEAIVVFTARSPERIVTEGGSQAWVLNAARAQQCTWLVCTQNRHHTDESFADATEPHGSAFLVGKVDRVVRASVGEDGKQRWKIAISEYARINVSDVWGHDRNPVRYLSRSELQKKGVELDDLTFRPLDQHVSKAPIPKATSTAGVIAPLTIAEARKGLAMAFGVQPEAVEITIRG